MRAIISSFVLFSLFLGWTFCLAGTTFPLQSTIDFENKSGIALNNDPMLRESIRQKIVEPDFFMKANFEFALYHELGHAIFYMLNIPVLGNEETAADRAAVLMMLYPQDNRKALEMIEKLAAVSGQWLVEWNNRGEAGDIALWDYHLLEMQRFFEIGCILYGSNPLFLDKLRNEQFLPLERARTCRKEYMRSFKNAERILQNWGRKKTGHPPAVAIKVEMEEPNSDFGRKVYNWLNQSRFLQITATRLSDTLDFRKPFKICIRNCDRATCYWDYKIKQVVICYELAERFWNNAGKVRSTMQEEKEKGSTLLLLHSDDNLRKHIQEISERTGKNKSEVIELLLKQDLQGSPPSKTEEQSGNSKQRVEAVK